jgi:poly-gamma-glutamate synthesis protein (capsule biosynthesis protein)
MRNFISRALVAVVVALIGMGIGAGSSNSVAHAQAQPSPCPFGVLLNGVYPSAIMRQDMRYIVYLPPCYERTTERYPVLYLMHGSNSDETLWPELGLADVLNRGITSGTLPPMIVVMPYGDWIANTNRFDNLSWSNVFLTELLPSVEATYRVDARRERRNIGGISRGGFWAFNIAYRHPDLFGAVGGHSAFFALENAPNRYNPLYLSRDQKGIDILRIWLDRGRNDYAFWGIDLMHKWLTRRGIDHSYTVHPTGDHNNDYWRAHLPSYLAFYAAIWPKHLIPAPSSAAPPRLSSGKASARLAAATVNTLFVPAVAFNSLQANLPSADLAAIKAGRDMPGLILDRPTAAALTALGFPPAPTIPVVEPNDLIAALWRTPDAVYTLIAFDRLSRRLRMLRVDETLPIDWIEDDPASYPFALSSDAPNYDPGKLTRFLLSGVTALTRQTMDAIDENGIEWAGEAIRPYTTRADFFHISNEVSFHPTCSQRARVEEKAIGPFCSKLYSLDLLSFVGVDIVELSGNHNLDFGVRPYLDTLRLYRERGLHTVGGGTTLTEARAPLIVDHAGTRVGLIACNWAGPQWALAKDDAPGAAWCDRGWLGTAIPALRQQVNVVIVSVQYKETDQITPPVQQQRDFQDLAVWGADVVIGSQAHLTQAFQFHPVAGRGEAFLHYGPGNLFFDQTYLQKRFFMDMLLIYDKKVLTVDLFAGITDESGRPRPMEVKERTFFMRTIFRNSLF